MHNNKFFRLFFRISGRITLFLPSLFWLLIIYVFDEPCVAGMTILSAVIHECGHEAYLLFSRSHIGKLRGSLSGFRIKKNLHASYRSDILLYASGPLFNLAVAFVFLALARIPDFPAEYANLFAIVNFATAASNLLPIRDYDGYGIIYSFIQAKENENVFLSLLDSISLFFIIMITFLALYVMARIGDGYWMAGLFLFSLVKEVSRGLNQ